MYKKILFFICYAGIIQGAQIDDSKKFMDELQVLIEQVIQQPWKARTIYHSVSGMGFVQAAHTLAELTGNQTYISTATNILAQQGINMASASPTIQPKALPSIPAPAWPNTTIDARCPSPATPKRTSLLSQSHAQFTVKVDSYGALARDASKQSESQGFYAKLIECCLRRKR